MFSQPMSRWFTRIPPLLGGLAIALLYACASSGPGGGAVSAAIPGGSADQFLIVDCLLPPQIRKLGTRMTYLAARRAIKTSAGDCEIRGGEYVAYDRANYATALKVWTTDAEAGDPTAQTYVGEIYEKGLGTTPDYNQAAQWYRKAADQGYARAQINLGYLYEKGLGVPRDGVKAVNLYRQASGLTGDQLAFTSSIQAAAQEQQALRQDSASRRQEASLLRAQLEQTRKQLEDRRALLESTQRELEKTRRQLQQQQSAPRAAPPPPPPPAAQIPDRRLAEQQRQIDQQRQELARLQQEAAQQQTRQQAELSAAQQRIRDLETKRAAAPPQTPQADAQLRQELAARQQEADALRAQLDKTRQQLEARRQSLSATERELAETRRELAQQKSAPPPAPVVSPPPVDTRLQQQLAEQQQRLDKQHQEMAYLQQEAERQQKQLQADLSAAQQRAKGLEQDVAYAAREQQSLQQQVDYLQKQLFGYQDQVNARKQELEQARSSLEQAQEALNTQQRSGSQNTAELERLQQQLNERTSELTQRQQQIASLETEVNRRQQEIERLKDIGAQQQVAATRSVSEPAPTAPSPLQQLQQLDFGGYHALIIGNSRYAQLPNLETPVKDAQAIAEVLSSRYGFQTKVLTDANRYDILSNLEQFRSRLTERDNFLLYYAGHGELDRTNDRGHWLPVDAEPESRANWISNVQITDILNSMNARHIMVIADSCYSGTLARTGTTSIEGGRSPEQKIKWFETMIKTPSRTVLTSGGVKPVLDSGGGGHSIFANALLQLLKANKEVLEGPLLYRQIAKEVKTAAARLNVEQDPRYAPMKFAGDLGAPFFFVPKGQGLALKAEVFDDPGAGRIAAAMTSPWVAHSLWIPE